MKFNLCLKQTSFILLMALLTACTLLNTAPPADSPEAPDEGLEAPVQNQVDSSEPEESSEEGESLSCFHASNFVLNFDHTLTINEAETSLTHILKQGGIDIGMHSIEVADAWSKLWALA